MARLSVVGSSNNLLVQAIKSLTRYLDHSVFVCKYTKSYFIYKIYLTKKMWLCAFLFVPIPIIPPPNQIVPNSVVVAA